VTRSQRKASVKPAIPAAIRSFVGHLEGSGKSAHTISNYLTDLRVFQQFLEKGLGSTPTALHQVTRADLEKFHHWLKAQGLKTNTRRRKILTVRRLLRYLTQRKKIEIDVGNKLPAPAKIERVPTTFDRQKLIEKIFELPSDSLLLLRNQVLLLTLAETACLVSEVTRMRFDDWSAQGSSARVAVGGTKAPRSLNVSAQLWRKVQALKELSGDSPWLFLGFNKAGPLRSPITPRGVELLVKAKLDINPRHFRHSAVLDWYKQGATRLEIQERLGLKTDYAFRVFEPLFKSIKSSSGATSSV